MPTGHFLLPNTTKVELHCNEVQLGNATGFFLKFNSNWYLVSNWHVYSGRKPSNGNPIDRRGLVPTHCTFYPSTIIEQKATWEKQQYSLLDFDSKHTNWLQHPILGQEVDIGVLPISSTHVGLAKDLLCEGHDDKMWVDLGSDVYLPGFPLGLTAGGYFPIWKKASLASSLEFDPGLSSYFYVDTATREGMSGSPCFAISNYQHYTMNYQTMKLDFVTRPISFRLLGVYSGRLNPSDNFEAQIGKVWRETLIIETIQGKCPGSYVIRPQ